MILFIFEGKEREPMLFKAMQRLFFEREQTIVCSYNNNIYQLYKEMKMDEDESIDIVSLLKEKDKKMGTDSLSEIDSVTDVSEVYLFFDYDFQNRNYTNSEIDNMLCEMLSYFSDETNHGKLYINYPMIESIRYFKSLDDPIYYSYKVTRDECRDDGFKSKTHEFSCKKSLDFLTLQNRREPTEKELKTRLENWNALKKLNVCKANYICSDVFEYPQYKSLINQGEIFKNQLAKYIEPYDSVAIVNAFPLFLYEYFKNS